MNKQELLSTYTPEQLAEMVVKQEEENQKLYDEARKWQKESKQHRKVYQTICHLEDLESERIRLKSEVEKYQNASEVKNDETHKLKWQISSLEEENGRLQAKVDTYNKYLLPRCTKEARRMIDENRFLEVRIATWDEWNNRGKDDMNISDIQKCQEEYQKLMKESPLQRTIDGIAKDIMEQKNNAMAMEFTKVICDLLKKNGVYVHCTETKLSENITHNSIEEKYGIVFDSVDFSQHDKEFTDKIEELQSEVDKCQKVYETTKKDCDRQIEEYEKKIEELKVENAELHCEMQAMQVFPDEIPTEPIKVAETLIMASGECEPLMLGKEVFKDTYRIFDISELRQIAEHLLVYCNNQKENVNE